MNYPQTLEYMYSQLPMYQRIGAAAYRADLENTIAICNLLHHPYHNFKSVHIAGTNGKGSTAHMLASILQSKGLKVGLYTSPHLKDFRERIRINGKMIPKTKVAAFVTKYKKDFERIKPSFFEMTVGLAFQYFSDEKVDIAVVEVGMGGRLDSTNVITPLVSVITNIGLDHTQFLGDTLAKIAAEKAGIIKPGIPVVIGETQPETRDVFREKADAGQSPIVFADEVYTSVFKGYSGNLRQWLTLDIYRNGELFIENLRCPLRGLYQSKNIAAVLQTVAVLNQSGYAIDEKDIRSGIQRVLAQTGLLGRWQTLSRSPLTICDCGHNPAGMTEVVRQINDTPHRNLHFVIGMVNDKDIDGVLQFLPADGIYYFCKAGVPRGLDARLLKEKAEKYHLKGDVYTSVKNALAAATAAAATDDLVFVGGSCFTVAEVV